MSLFFDKMRGFDGFLTKNAPQITLFHLFSHFLVIFSEKELTAFADFGKIRFVNKGAPLGEGSKLEDEKESMK